ncbi:hypothetical protein ACFL3A_14255 [Pseudomonadota bacterium]
MMRNAMAGVCCAVLVIGQMGCSNPHKEAAKASTEASKAEAEVSNQKAKILEDYRKCLNKNKGDEKACEGYKKATDSM